MKATRRRASPTLVGVQSRGVDHLLRGDVFALGPDARCCLSSLALRSGVPGRITITPAASAARSSALTSASASTIPWPARESAATACDRWLACRDDGRGRRARALRRRWRARRAKRLEVGTFGASRRDDELAAARVGHTVLLRRIVEQAAPCDAQRRLQRARRIVEAGVDDAAVVGAGVEARARVPFEHADRAAALRRSARAAARPDHARADDDHIDLLHAAARKWL